MELVALNFVILMVGCGTAFPCCTLNVLLTNLIKHEYYDVKDDILPILHVDSKICKKRTDIITFNEYYIECKITVCKNEINIYIFVYCLKIAKRWHYF